ncbi:MAG: hypothetical protein K2L35_01830, partial [Muribaculaceae bacterium]|nr:hypothetical protein [Muribaculaceae bacterium]
ADGQGKNLPDEALCARIKALKGPVKLRTFVSLTCTNCPDVAQALNVIALLNPGVENTVTDCAVVPDPTSEELAQIAVETAKTTKNIAGLDPVVAMLSFSTWGSASHERVDKVRNAVEIAKKMDPSLVIDGELQSDAAIVKEVADKKAPGSEVAGHANTLVFPSLEVGNIAYKLVQRLAGAGAVGPILQGLAAPVNDLSRGATVDDIVNTIIVTCNQAIGEKNNK